LSSLWAANDDENRVRGGSAGAAGDTAPVARGIDAHYADGKEFSIDRISMVDNTGTYLDSPFHRFAAGVDLAGLPLTSLVDLPAVVVRTRGASSRAVDVGSLAAVDVSGRAIPLHTGGDRRSGTRD
jgi:arylformamidase